MPIEATTVHAVFLPADPLGIARFGWSASAQRYFAQVVRLELDGTEDLQLFRERIHTAQGVAAILAPWVTLSSRLIRELDRDRLIRSPGKTRGGS